MVSVHLSERHAWKKSELELLQDVIKRACATIDRARTDVALSASKARFRAIVDLVPDMLWSNDSTGSVDWFNRRWTEYTGQPLEEALGFGWLRVIHPDDMPSAWQRWHEAIEAQRMYVNEHCVRHRDGTWRSHYVRSEPLLDAEGQVVRWYGTALDIHEQRSAREFLEQQVHQRTAELRTVLDSAASAASAASAIIATDLHWRITTPDPAGEALLGLPAVQALGRRVSTLPIPWSGARACTCCPVLCGRRSRPQKASQCRSGVATAAKATSGRTSALTGRVSRAC